MRLRLLIIVLLLSSSAQAFNIPKLEAAPTEEAAPKPKGQQLIYQDTTETVIIKHKLTINKTAKGYFLEAADTQGKTRIYTNPDYTTYQMNYISPSGQTNIEAKLLGKTMVFYGVTGKGTIEESVKLDEEPWYGSPFLLKNFILSNEKEMKFYLTTVKDTSVDKLKAIKEKEETVKVNGRDVDTIKVKLTFPDWRSFFWSSYYWYRKSDGMLVKSKATHGLFGGPETIMELLSE